MGKRVVFQMGKMVFPNILIFFFEAHGTGGARRTVGCNGQWRICAGTDIQVPKLVNYIVGELWIPQLGLNLGKFNLGFGLRFFQTGRDGAGADDGSANNLSGFLCTFRVPRACAKWVLETEETEDGFVILLLDVRFVWHDGDRRGFRRGDSEVYSTGVACLI